MTFKYPLMLAAAPLVLLWFFNARKKRAGSSFLFPSDDIIKGLGGSLRAWLADRAVYLRLAAVLLVIAALARPQVAAESTKRGEGIAIMLSIDCSSTMLAEDLQLPPSGLLPVFEDPGAKAEKRLSRLDNVKEVARSFVRADRNDMIGLVAFAGYAYVLCPPTFDRDWLMKSIGRVKVGMIKDATAIGSGILAGVDSLDKVKAKSKVVILLTDGNNNYGKVPPLVAARTAKALGVKIYTVGVVTKGHGALYPVREENGKKVYDYVGIEMDENTLKDIAEITGGRYYRVNSLAALEESYRDIGALERSLLREEAEEEGQDVYAVFLSWALALLLAEIALGATLLRKIP
jgi:Ca-activated chloride channel family protein